jgi:UPF0755 protein
MFKIFKLYRKLVIVTILIIAAAISVAAIFYYQWAESGSQDGKSVNLVVGNGQTIDGLASKLASLKIIRSRFAFLIYLHFHPAPLLIAGDYQLHQDTSFNQLFAAFKKGPTEFSLLIPPGFTLTQIAQRVGQIPNHSASSFLAFAESSTVVSPFEPASVRGTPFALEGLLAATTYQVQYNETNLTLLTQMVNTFDSQVASLGLNPRGTYIDNLSAYQVIIAASIVREEAGLDSDRPKVARVIINRLSDSMALQMDSTVRFAVGDPPTAPTTADLKVNSPYNTYIYKGLPPTPIATVSGIDVSAVLNPTPGSWLYFVVVDKNGGEAFSTTYQQQVQNENLAKSRGLAG